jgi:hypothetical protein
MLPSSPVRQLSLTGASTGSADPLVKEVAHDNGVSREKSVEGVELKKRIERVSRPATRPAQADLPSEPHVRQCRR